MELFLHKTVGLTGTVVVVNGAYFLLMVIADPMREDGAEVVQAGRQVTERFLNDPVDTVEKISH
jgi:hypothetical protein